MTFLIQHPLTGLPGAKREIAGPNF